MAAERRGEEDHLVAARLREGLVRRLATGLASRGVEEAVHPGDAGRRHARLGDPERLRVERDLGVGTHDRVRVVLVGARVGTRTARLADAAVAHGLERPPRVPQLDDPDVGVVHPVDHRLVVVDHDDVGTREQPRQADAVEQAPALGDARLEQGEQLVLPVQAPFDHPVVDDLEVAAELGARIGAEQDPPAVPPRDRPKDPERRPEQAEAQDPQRARNGASATAGGRARPGRRRCPPR